MHGLDLQNNLQEPKPFLLDVPKRDSKGNMIRSQRASVKDNGLPETNDLIASFAPTQQPIEGEEEPKVITE